MNMVTEATFNELEQAQTLKQRLEAAGLRAEIHDERKLQRFWFMSENFAGVHLRVDKRDYAAAKKLLEEWDAREGILRTAVHCPSCQSLRVEYPQFTRKFVSPTIYAFLCAIGLFQKKFYCQECHFTWPPTEKIHPPTDLLGWPVRPKEGEGGRKS